HGDVVLSSTRPPVPRGPDRRGAVNPFDTSPSSPSLQACLNTEEPSSSVCSFKTIPSGLPQPGIAFRSRQKLGRLHRGGAVDGQRRLHVPDLAGVTLSRQGVQPPFTS